MNLLLPPWAKWAALAFAVLALVLGYRAWLHAHTRAAVEADRAQANAAAVSAARQADERAHAAADSSRETINQENADAKAAADSSDDPLRAAFDSLRSTGAHRDGEASR